MRGRGKEERGSATNRLLWTEGGQRVQGVHTEPWLPPAHLDPEELVLPLEVFERLHVEPLDGAVFCPGVARGVALARGGRLGADDRVVQKELADHVAHGGLGGQLLRWREGRREEDERKGFVCVFVCVCV